MNSWSRCKVPVLFALVILLPVVLAALTLRQGWYEPGTRNKGAWLDQEVYLLQPLRPIRANGGWSIWPPGAVRRNASRCPS